MRVLFAQHVPFDADPRAQHLGHQLLASGHDVHGLSVDPAPSNIEPFSIRHVLCSSVATDADLPFELPQITPNGSSKRSFASLSDRELTDYRQILRDHLDAEVHTFDPHIIHVQSVWLLGQLALETGVPYVVTVWGPELDDAVLDHRYRPFVEQAAENAGRLIVGDKIQHDRLVATIAGIRDRVVIARPDDITAHLEIYYSVLNQRFGFDEVE